MRRLVTALLAAFFVLTQSACLGTVVQAPTRKGVSQSTTQAHIVALPTRIDATACRAGLAEVATYVPLWGLAVGFLTLGIVVPMTTQYSCSAAS